MGLSNKTKGAVQTNSNVKNSEIKNGGNLSLLSGNNLTLAATNVVVDGNIDLQVVDQLLITADEAVANSENWNKKSGFFSGDSLYKKTEHKDGEGITEAQASSINAQGKITGNVGAGKIVGSDVDGQQGVEIISDTGDITTARTTRQAFTLDKTLSVGLGDLANNLSRPDKIVDNKDGRATLKIADAQYDALDTKTTTTTQRSSTISSDEDVTLTARNGKLSVDGSNITADADQNQTGTLDLAGATGINVTNATNTEEKTTKETHGSAELSVVVQHQAVEMAKAVIAVDEAKDALKKSKQEYNAYERNLDNLDTSLKQLETDYANKTPGVNYDDVLELRTLINDARDDKEWYQAGIALASVNLASATTALMQQTAATAPSAVTWGFNAGVQLDVDASKSKTSEHSITAVASELSGHNIVVQTGRLNDKGERDRTGTSTNIQGSHMAATDSIAVQTGELNITNSQNTKESRNETEHGHITAQMTVYSWYDI